MLYLNYLSLVSGHFYEVGTFITHVLQIMGLRLRVKMKPVMIKYLVQGYIPSKEWSQDVDPDRLASTQVHTASL